MYRLFLRGTRNGGTWWIEFRDARGTRRYKSLRVTKREARAQRDAEAVADELIAELRRRGVVRQSGPVPELVVRYLRAKARQARRGRALSPRTVDRYRAALGHFAAFLEDEGIAKLAHLRPVHVDAFMDRRLGASAAPGTVNNELRAIRTFLNWLGKRDELVSHPFVDLEFVGDASAEDDAPSLLPAEIARMVAAARVPPGSRGAARARYTPDELEDMVMAAAYTGGRREELFQLRDDDFALGQTYVFIDPRTGARTVGHGMLRFRGSVSKSRRDRWVPMPAVFYPHAERMRARAAETGSCWTCRDARTMWRRAKRLARLAGVEGKFTFKHFRNTYATWLVQAGAHPEQVKELLGHADVEVTQRYYRGAYRRPERLAPVVAALPMIRRG